jgi:hypothetical protein
MDMEALADCKENRFVHLRHFLLLVLCVFTQSIDRPDSPNISWNILQSPSKGTGVPRAARCICLPPPFVQHRTIHVVCLYTQ